MFTLGINAAFHDCSAVLVRDGEVVAASEDERFTHVKHGKRPLPFTTWQLPFHAIDDCLRQAGIVATQVDRFAYSFDPRLLDVEGATVPGQPWSETITLPLEPSTRAAATVTTSPWDPLFLAYIVNAPRQLASGAPHHLQARFRGLTDDFVLERWRWVEHHLSHEASAFLASPYDECAVLTMDGRGERATTSLGHWSRGAYRRLRQVDLPHSLGLLYENVTRWLGFLHSSDEYKVMALASFGRPVYVDVFTRAVRLTGDGTYTIAPLDLVDTFGPARLRSGAVDQLHLDVAHSLQVVLEETALALAEWLHETTHAKALCMAGGVALNCVMNAKLRDRSSFDHVWVQPAAGDAGTALGAALWTDRQERGVQHTTANTTANTTTQTTKLTTPPPWRMTHALLGPSFDDAEIERFLTWSKLRFKRLDHMADEVASILAQDRIVGWFNGRMEFGPRALGARSILASPISPSMQQRLNELKDREDFRPVAPMVLEERAHLWFESGRARAARRQMRAVANGPGAMDLEPSAADAGWPAPFMLFTFDVREDKRDRIPAVSHVDGSARVQTVNAHQHPQVHALLHAFERRTGVPVLVNTSFNTRGEPVVCTPRDAVESFWTSPLDALVIGSYLLEKTP